MAKIEQVASESNKDVHVPRYPFPDNPTVTVIGGYEVYEYISEKQITAAIDLISSQINFADFDAILVNMEGAAYLFKRLAEKVGYKGESVEIEYHGHNGQLTIDKPVPAYLREKKCLLVDDVYDTGHTLNAILGMGLSTESVCVTLVSKRIDNKEPVLNLIIGLEVDNKWLAGCGMDLKDEHAGPFRELPRIVAMKNK